VRRLVAAAPPGLCAVVRTTVELPAAAREVNALCVLLTGSPVSTSGRLNKAGRPAAAADSGPGSAPLLVLCPAGTRLELRWLALVLGTSRRRVALAPPAACAALFRAVPGPPRDSDPRN
jgi:hypothetical protein